LIRLVLTRRSRRRLAFAFDEDRHPLLLGVYRSETKSQSSRKHKPSTSKTRLTLVTGRRRLRFPSPNHDVKEPTKFKSIKAQNPINPAAFQPCFWLPAAARRGVYSPLIFMSTPFFQDPHFSAATRPGSIRSVKIAMPVRTR
jgi:hypothetical protein